MTIRRFYVNFDQFFHNTITITEDEHHHLKNVYRLTVGTEIIVVCGDEYDYHARIEEIGKNSTIATITKKVKNQFNPAVKVTVFQALTKKDAMSNLVQKLSELGVSEFVPLETQNTTAKDKVNKADKLQTVANQSTKQCKRSIPLNVLPTMSFIEMVKQFHTYDLVIFANETEQNTTLFDAFETVNQPKHVAIVIGSEGGFTPEEMELAKQNGAKSITLGKRILRVETATIATTAIAMHHLHELGN